MKHTAVLRFLASLLVSLFGTLFLSAAEPIRVRVASYNIQYLSASQLREQGDRAEKLKQVIAKLDADVIGLQEIDDRAALEAIFDPQQWQLLIDDDSPSKQDLAIAVRKPFALAPRPDLNANDADFLFSGAEFEDAYKDRRDALVGKVVVPGMNEILHVMVVHQKSRLGGRAVTDPIREKASKLLLGKLETEFDGKLFAVLGDFNDNADDRSLNILETGNPDAVGKAENEDGPFLFNPSEELLAQDIVSHGKRDTDIDGATRKIRLPVPGSRQRNDTARGTDENTGPILFDQILVPMTMRSACVPGSFRVFDDAVAIEGTFSGRDATRASDHLPVSLDFAFRQSAPGLISSPTDMVRIAALLPDPFGPDPGKETVTLQNLRATTISLERWTLRDRAGNTFTLTGSIEPRGTLTIILPPGKLPLNNSGDDVKLLDGDGITVHQVTYTQTMVVEGAELHFP
jgi:endonuclease/exonuclease/phosphatase family metal-dependent hydrolase